MNGNENDKHMSEPSGDEDKSFAFSSDTAYNAASSFVGTGRSYDK
jgi:hypothetical protein